MAYTKYIAEEMGISQNIVDMIANNIGVRGDYKSYGEYYKISDQNVPKLKKAIRQKGLDEVQKERADKTSNPKIVEKAVKEIIQIYNISDLVAENGDEFISEESKKLAQLQEKLDLIEQEKKETAEIVERIQEKFFK